jgi:hypothetical protein
VIEFAALKGPRAVSTRRSGGQSHADQAGTDSGLPKKELVERLHYHQRQSEISDRAIGFYLLDMEKRKLYRPLESVTVWARKHLPQTDRPDKLLLFAKRLEDLPAIEAAFPLGRDPWTKTRRSQGSPIGAPNRSG